MGRRRQETSDRLVYSDAAKKLVVAGPGTGKTHNFKRILERAGGGLALTFIRALAEDLERDLGDLAQVNTFHGYCKHMAHKLGGVGGLTAEFDYFPHLPELVVADLEILGYGKHAENALDQRIREMEVGDGLLPAALQVGNYYDAVGHNDIVYRVERHFSDNPEDVPEHEVVVVDEYQDFNYLETRLIDALAGASPVVIAGDDDQALYGFKGSSAEFIRRLAQEDDVEEFDLPYCSRCTEVVVEAVKQIVQEAQRRGNLADRIERGYLCYLPEKGIDSDNHPQLIHARCTVEMNKAPYIRRYVGEQIAEIPDEDIAVSHEKGHPTALVIGPVHWVGPVYEFLAEQFANVRYLRSEKSRITLLDAYRRLARDFASRVGWRIVLHLDACEGWQAMLKVAHEEESELAELIPREHQERHRRSASLVGRLVDGEELSADEIAELEEAVGLEFGAIMASIGIDPEEESDQRVLGSEERDEDQDAPSIVCTSLVGAKGLSAEHVFIVGFVNGEFPKHAAAPTDDEVCQLIVGLSRTRKACHLISCGRWAGQPKVDSEFLKWFGDIAVETRNVNKDYWND